MAAFTKLFAFASKLGNALVVRGPDEITCQLFQFSRKLTKPRGKALKYCLAHPAGALPTRCSGEEGDNGNGGYLRSFLLKRGRLDLSNFLISG